MTETALEAFRRTQKENNDEIKSALKLQELVEKKSKKRSNGCDGTERDCPTCAEINVCKEILEEIKK